MATHVVPDVGTIWTALTLASAGDSIQIRPGTYVETLDVIDWPGGTLGEEWGQVITISGMPGEARPVIQAPGGSLFVMSLRGNSQSGRAPRYLHFDGIVFDASQGIQHDVFKITAYDPTFDPADSPSHHIRFTNCRFTGDCSTNGTGHGIGILITWGSVGVEIIDCELDNIGWTGEPAGEAIYGAADDLLIERCHIHHNGAFGASNINSFPGLATRGHITRYCHVHHNGLRNPNQPGGGINEGEGGGNQIYGNSVHHNAGRGIIVAFGDGSQGAIVANNSIAANGEEGLYISGANTGTIVVNNISYGNKRGEYTGLGIDTVHAGNLPSDPGWADPANGDLHITASSPAYHTGTHIPQIAVDLDYVPYANPPSMGCYEVGGEPVTPPIEPPPITEGGGGTPVGGPIFSTFTGSTDNNSVTTDAADTSGVQSFVVFVSNNASTEPNQLTDTYDNLWTPHTPYGSVCRGQFYSCATPAVGAGHVFHLSDVGNSFPCLFVLGSAQTLVLDGENGFDPAADVSSCPSGAVTPSAEALIVSGVAHYHDVGVVGVDSWFTKLGEVTSAANTIPGAVATTTQTAGSPITATWTWNGATSATAAITAWTVGTAAPGGELGEGYEQEGEAGSKPPVG